MHRAVSVTVVIVNVILIDMEIEYHYGELVETVLSVYLSICS